jgi:hypothetical protein
MNAQGATETESIMEAVSAFNTEHEEESTSNTEPED